MLAKVGPSHAGSVTTFLKRRIGYDAASDHHWGHHNEGSVAAVLSAAGLAGVSTNGAATPGSKAIGASLRDGEVLLDANGVREFMSQGGSLTSISFDRPDLQLSS